MILICYLYIYTHIEYIEIPKIFQDESFVFGQTLPILSTAQQSDCPFLSQAHGVHLQAA